LAWKRERNGWTAYLQECRICERRRVIKFSECNQDPPYVTIAPLVITDDWTMREYEMEKQIGGMCFWRRRNKWLS
jgi:hypothetical protein